MTLRELRQQTGLSQADIARLVGVQVGAVNRWENGRAVPTMRHRRRLAKLYRVGTCELGLDKTTTGRSAAALCPITPLRGE